jgi:hypothetical protein
MFGSPLENPLPGVAYISSWPGMALLAMYADMAPDGNVC